jgi:hypothetical protein
MYKQESENIPPVVIIPSLVGVSPIVVILNLIQDLTAYSTEIRTINASAASIDPESSSG